jgi:hypothetical protein
MTKYIPIIAASTRFTTLLSGLSRFLTSARRQAHTADISGAELSHRLRYDVGLSDCRERQKAVGEDDVRREMMRRSI